MNRAASPEQSVLSDVHLKNMIVKLTDSFIRNILFYLAQNF